MGNVLHLTPLNAWLDFDQYFGMRRSESHLLAKITYQGQLLVVTFLVVKGNFW